MAIYHLRAKVISRGAGRNAVNAAAYRRGAAMRDERTGETFSYTGKRDVMHSEIAIPEKTPAWARALLERHELDPVAASAELWNRVELHEKRADAQLAREIEIALPAELSLDQNIALVREFVSEQLTSRGMAADWSIHEGKNENIHAHIMLTMRPLTEEGFGGKKAAAIDPETGQALRDKRGRILYAFGNLWGGKADLLALREQWADYANLRLTRAGHGVCIDHRSHEAQGIDVTPTVHFGVQAKSMDEHGKPAERADAFEEARAAGARQIAERPERVFDLITHKAAVFTRRDMAREVSRYIDDAREFQAIMARLEASPELRRLAPEEGRRPARYSTRAMIKAERDMIAAAERMRRAQSHGVDPEHALAALARFPQLSEEQQAAVLHVTGQGRIALIAGAAGAGKSTALAAAREAFERQGLRVRGAALAGKAAEGLQEGAGIESRTIASLEYAWSQGRDRLQARDVLIVDEAGMIGSRQLGRVLGEARAAGAKVVLVGDAQQLQPIEAGAAFRAIAERAGVAEIGAIRRQREDWAREASMAFAKGKARAGLDAYRARGSVRLMASREEAKAELVRDWLAARRPDASTIILAHARADVRDLNEAVRAARRGTGELGGDAPFKTEQGARAFAAGDRVVFLRNDRELGVKNGTLGRVEQAAPDRLSVVLDNGEHRTVEAQAYAALDHGYAVTIHKAQGATVDLAFVLASGGMDRHLAYVGMTRHRTAATLYAGRDDFKSYEAMAARLSRSRPKETTLDFAERRGIDTLRDWIENGRALLTAVRERFERAAARLFERPGFKIEERRKAAERGDGPGAQASAQERSQNAGAGRPAGQTELERDWNAAVAREFQGVKAKAGRILAKIEKRKDAIAKDLQRIEQGAPAAPKGLGALLPGAKGRRARELAAWTRQRGALLAALRREEQRGKAVREYSEEGLAGFPGVGEKLAQRKAERRNPRLAQAMQAAREQRKSERVAAARRELERGRERGGRERGR